MRIWLLCAALVLAACGRAPAPAGQAQPELAAPTQPETIARAFAPTANAPTGPISVAVSTQMGGAEVLTLTGQNGMVMEAELAGAADPSALVEGRTLRALMGLNVQASQTLVYRVTRVEGAWCTGGAATHMVVWEPDAPGDAQLALLPLRGGAPGESGAHACAPLAYRRA